MTTTCKIPVVKPLLALTMGDPAGIGPEIVVGALRDARVRRACRAVVVGSSEALRREGWRPALAPLLDPGAECRPRPGRPDTAGAAASFAAVRLATEFALRGLVRGIVTAPIAKDGWRSAGIEFPDHTDYLQSATRSREVAMMLVADGLRSIPVTRHVALSEVSGRLRVPAIVAAARLASAALRDGLGVRSVRLGLCAFNPHAGESGMMGGEERKVLGPALREARRAGLRMDGPHPADSAWAAHRAGRFDALISLYHDQAMIPLKVLHPYGIVNWTVGIPIVRTSPGHGTAFDIAGKRRANSEAMVQAILLAARLNA